MKEGDHVYVLGKASDTLATVTAVDDGQVQVSMETDQGTRLFVRSPDEIVPEKDFARMAMLSALSARTELWRAGQDIEDLDAEGLTAALEKQGLSQGTACQCAGLFRRDEWQREQQPMTRWLDRIRDHFFYTAPPEQTLHKQERQREYGRIQTA